MEYPHIKLREQLPVLNVGSPDRPSYLATEVCEVLLGQVIKRRLSPDQILEMIKFACRKTWENCDSIVGDGKATLGLNLLSNPFLGKMGLEVGRSLITVAAPGSLGPWTYILFNSNRPRAGFGPCFVHQNVMKFKDFVNCAGIDSNGFIQSPPDPVINPSDGEDAANKMAIDSILSRMHTAPKKPRFVPAILPSSNVAIHNSIKTSADTKHGIHTVCVVASKFLKEQRQDQYFGNISLKFNLKAGGINNTVDLAKLGIVGQGKTMLVGLDATHPSPRREGSWPAPMALWVSGLHLLPFRKGARRWYHL
ncbi:uncharacterized protein BP5553_10418 [Venustampulla echinocandica]|uniref:Piwi domain-containing protein n=1 Tax=Venustampulla echinocandica TaxID=2656787 RepID=A0A370T992_9HELO|nr:uncharacterized protein BP5553_10418 [Venustampulla echinocandica]RDL30140.1 hypothetical protein BP5553_10418 [Venustampulla echinocandica]